MCMWDLYSNCVTCLNAHNMTVFLFPCKSIFCLRIIYWNIKTLPIVLIPINGSNWQTFHCCFIKIWEKNKNKLHESDLWDCRAVWLLLCSLWMDFYNMTTIHYISICSLKKISWLPECVLYCGSPAGSQRESKYIFNEVICNNNCVHGPDLLMLSTTAKPSFGMKKPLLEWNDEVQHRFWDWKVWTQQVFCWLAMLSENCVDVMDGSKLRVQW